MNRVWIFLYAFLTLLIFFAPAYAQDPTDAPVKGSTCAEVSVREQPGGPIITRLSENTTIEILGYVQNPHSRRWVHIREPQSNLEGFIDARYVRERPFLRTVSANELNVRATPSHRAEIIGQFGRDQQIEFLGRETINNNGGQWIYVRVLEQDIEGWVRFIYVIGNF